MKKISKIIIIILLVNIPILAFTSHVSMSQDSVYTSPKETMEINGDTNFTVYSTASLTWELNSQENYTIYFNSTGVPVGENITLVTVAIYYNIPKKERVIATPILTPQINFTGVNQQYEILSVLRPPSDADEFNITIEIVACSTSEPENQQFNAQFPGDREYIDITKNLVLPALPGFPDIETFARWIFIFSVAFVIISLPAIFVASFKIQELVKARKKSGKKKKTKTRKRKRKGGKKK